MTNPRSTVLTIEGPHRATSEPIIEETPLHRPGVLAVEAYAVSPTATVTIDPDVTSLAQLVGWVDDCGHRWDVRSLPEHVCSLGFAAAAPVGLGDDVFMLILSLPVVFHAADAPESAGNKPATCVPVPAGHR